MTQPQDDVFEMLWDCRYCGQKKLLGLTHRFCPGCGAPQDPSTRYFPSDAEKVPVRAHRFVGADVACPACRTPSSRAAKNCGHCGSPLAQGGAVATQGPQVQAAPGAQWQQAGATPPPKPGMSTTAKVLLGLGAAALVGIALVVILALTWKRSGTYQVVAHAWDRSIAVEKLGPVKKSEWCDSLPSGARTLRRTSAQRSTEKIPDGQECKKIRKDQGDGTFKEVNDCKPKFKEKPVMADKCDYEVDEWASSRTLSASGADLDPKWPDAKGLREGTCVGCERAGKRTEKYTLTLQGPKGAGDLEQCELPEARWKSIPDKSRWKAKVGVLTGSVDCESLEKP